MSEFNSNNLSKEEAIQTLEQINDIKFSKEQLEILNAPLHQPLVVNACAGSGKTTIFVYKAILNMLTGESNGKDTFGITFSKAAQVEMQKRFYNLREKLITAGIDIPALLNCDPRFKTFHALFFQLLRSYNPYLHVLINPESDPRFTFTFYNILARSRYEMDDNEVLKDIFNLRDELINRGWSIDGLTVPEFSDYDDPIQAVASNLNIPSHTEKFFNDYVEIIKTYQNMKERTNLIDFTDMKVILYQQIYNDESARNYYTEQLNQYKYFFLDEFQDIDNLQWKLIKLLLSDSAKQNLFVIGDDDQAIYGFRGGSAKYIINFTDSFPTARQFHLSMNYRTGGQILNTARPMIKKNPVRIDKNLLAYHKGNGNIYVNYCKPKTMPQSDATFKRLLDITRNPDVSNEDIAVLVRHNTTRSMVADFLANHGIYANISHTSFILQSNKIYRTYKELMQALLSDDFDAFYRHAKEIGFSKYKNHVKSLVVESGFKLDQIEKISIYLALAHQSSKRPQMKSIDKIVTKYYKKAQSVVSKNTDQTKDALEDLYQNVHQLVDSYYGYMTKKQFISSNDYLMATETLRNNLSSYKYKTPQAFFDHEEEKAYRISKVTKNQSEKDLDILTLHQAKGLQYPYVFLIGLDNTDFDSDSVELAHLFSSDTTYKQFLKILHDSQPTDNKQNLSRPEEICKRIWNSSKNQNDTHIPHQAFQTVYDMQVRDIFPPKENNDTFHFIDKTRYVENNQHPVKKIKKTTADDGHIIPTTIEYIDAETGDPLTIHKKFSNEKLNQYDQDIQSIYRSYIYNAEFVESERKLLYVGITRSQAYMYLDVPAFPNPLLRELNLKQSIKEESKPSPKKKENTKTISKPKRKV